MFAFAAAGMTLIVGVSGITIGSLNAERDAQNSALAEQLELVDPLSCLGAGAGANQDRCPMAFSVPDSIDALFASEDKPPIECTASPYGTKVRSCEFGRTGGLSGRIALLGDSHAGALLPAIDSLAFEGGLSLSTYLKQGCSGLDPIPSTSRDSAKLAKYCADWADKAINKIIRDTSLSTVIITYASNARAYYADTSVDRMTTTLKRLTEAKKTVLFIFDSPATGGRKIPECLEAARTQSECTSPRADVTRGSSRDAIAIAQLPGVTSFSLADLMCDEQTCYPVIGGVIGYFDADHLTTTFTLTAKPFLGSALNKTLLSGN